MSSFSSSLYTNLEQTTIGATPPRPPSTSPLDAIYGVPADRQYMRLPRYVVLLHPYDALRFGATGQRNSDYQEVQYPALKPVCQGRCIQIPMNKRQFSL